LIRPERKQKRRRRAHRLQIRDEIRHALARAAVGVDINFERETDSHEGKRPIFNV